MSDSCNLMDCRPPTFSVHGISQARTLERVVVFFSSWSFWPRDRIHICIEVGLFTIGPPGKPHTRVCVYFFTLQVITRYCAMCCVLRHSVVSDSLQPFWNVVHQAPVSMGFSRQDYWSGLPCPPPEDFPNPGIGPWSPTLQADSLPSELPGKPVRHWDTEYCSLGYTLGPCSSILFIVLWYL